MLSLIAAMMMVQAEAAAPVASNADDPIVCTRRANSTVGTRMKQKRTCLRKSDWDYIEKQTQQEMQSLRDRHLSPGRTDVDRGGPN